MSVRGAFIVIDDLGLAVELSLHDVKAYLKLDPDETCESTPTMFVEAPPFIHVLNGEASFVVPTSVPPK